MNNARSKANRKPSTGRPSFSMFEGLESRQFMSASMFMPAAQPIYAPTTPPIVVSTDMTARTSSTTGTDIHIVRQLDKSSVK